jgi:hypothetical protein
MRCGRGIPCRLDSTAVQHETARTSPSARRRILCRIRFAAGDDLLEGQQPAHGVAGTRHFCGRRGWRNSAVVSPAVEMRSEIRAPAGIEVLHLLPELCSRIFGIQLCQCCRIFFERSSRGMGTLHSLDSFVFLQMSRLNKGAVEWYFSGRTVSEPACDPTKITHSCASRRPT